MSNDEISASSSNKELKEWVVNISRSHKKFPDIPTESSQPNSTNSNSTEETAPSIFSSTPCFVGFNHEITKSFLYNSRITDQWKFVEFMERWHVLNLNSYYKHIQKEEHLVWSYYMELDPGYRPQWIRYLLVNSCIIIFVILSFQYGWNGIEIFTGTKQKLSDPRDERSIEFSNLYQRITSSYPRRVKCGMLDMDSQIPWFVVEAVYTEHSSLSKFIGTPIKKLAFSCFDDLYPRVHKSKVRDGTVTQPPGGFKHLLHMFHWSRTPEEKYLVEMRPLQPIKNMESFYIPSATDLQLSETVFEKHAGDSIDVSYCERGISGVMQLAPLRIFKYSNQLYKDLLRFEEGYVNCGFSFTAYVACMVCLLRTEADVRLLRANGIVPSTWNDEKDVLDFVHENRRTVLPHYVRMPNDLNNLMEKVMAHHQSTTRYYGEFKRYYCSNPCITISVVAATTLFVLTFIQTIYGTLSYYKQ